MRPTNFSIELIIAHKGAIVYPEQFNRKQVMIQKSLINQNNPDKIEEVDSSAEQSDKIDKSRRYKRERSSSEYSKLSENRLSIHIGSVEEYLGSRVLFEQGQMRVGDYCFFVNLYFKRFKLDLIHDCKDFFESLIYV